MCILNYKRDPIIVEIAIPSLGAPSSAGKSQIRYEDHDVFVCCFGADHLPELHSDQSNGSIDV